MFSHNRKQIYATGLFSPYDEAGKVTLKANGKGVYYIIKSGVIVYVGKSHTDIKKTLYRHFQVWNDKRTVAGRQYTRYERVTYAGQNMKLFKCKVLFLKDDDKIDILENALIKRHKPKDNTQKLYLFSEYDEGAMLERLKKVEFVPVGTEEDYF